MIHPSVNELTENKKINRYSLVVATAKCARIITDEYVHQKEVADKIAQNNAKDGEKKVNLSGLIRKEYRDEKAVKSAVAGLYKGEFKVIGTDGSVELLGHKRDDEEGSDELLNEEQQERIDNYALNPNENKNERGTEGMLEKQ